jgi:predicted acylesterase/phospholipase RssA
MEQLCHLPAHITMEGLYQKTGKWFECNAVCVEEDRHVFINHETWPGLCVADALVMSMCLPVLFQPVNIKGKLYVDGGLHQNLLINRYPIEQTIAIATAPPHRPTGLEDENTEQCASA